MNPTKQTMVLIAEDDADDRLLIQKAFTKSWGAGKLIYVENGEELVKYLKRQDPYNNETESITVKLLHINNFE